MELNTKQKQDACVQAPLFRFWCITRFIGKSARSIIINHVPTIFRCILIDFYLVEHQKLNLSVALPICVNFSRLNGLKHTDAAGPLGELGRTAPVLIPQYNLISF